MIPRAHFSAPVLNEGTGRQVLQQLRGRFLRVNQGRLARAREGLAPRQQPDEDGDPPSPGSHRVPELVLKTSQIPQYRNPKSNPLPLSHHG